MDVFKKYAARAHVHRFVRRVFIFTTPIFASRQIFFNEVPTPFLRSDYGQSFFGL